MGLPNPHTEETIMSTTHALFPDVARFQVAQRLREAERRRLSRHARPASRPASFRTRLPWTPEA